MHNIKNIRAKGYKAFSNDQYISIENVSRVNVIIGKNNCGKTSLLDIMEALFDQKSLLKPGTDIGDIGFDISLDDSVVNSVFSGGLSGIGRWNKSNFTDFIKNKFFPFRLKVGNNFEITDNSFNDLSGHINGINKNIASRRALYCFKKISAERNVFPEPEGEPTLQSSGEGASNLIATFLNDSNYNENIIEKDFLNALNLIMKPDAEFESIRVQQVTYNGTRLWEVFLQEKGAQRIPLSKTGSGLKTIVLVLLNLLVIPHTEEYKNKKIVYGFEELENNLHPALQRRLFEYIYDYAITKNLIVFLTTHSHIAINTFYDKDNSSIYHVVKDNGVAQVKRIESYIDKTEILDDLDVKASDILQSNGIVWVEGPSDRVYIKRWLEIFTPNKYIEGRHYQFLYYGGRLLSQYSAKEETDLINIITTNRNAAIVIDSDKRNRSAKLNDTKKRIIDEFNNLGMFHWVTKGKEIENYIPKNAIETMLGIIITKDCKQYQLFPDYISQYYKNFSNKKVPFANEIKEFITANNSGNILDLKKQIQLLYKQIETWNQ
ncbi:MAG: AAA family ATPase [Clostridia bacterium]|nr:AAA family ATPase [Clostridia bacterium]